MDYTRFEDIPNSSADVIYTDNPWMYYGDPQKMAAAGKHYDLMTDEELKALPVLSKCSKRAVVFMWVTGPRLDFGIDVMRAWGLHYRGIAFVWVKTRQDGQIIGAQGVRPSIVKPTTELVLEGSVQGDDVDLVLAGSTVRTGRPLSLLDEGVPQVVLAPRGLHSAKPPEVRRRIERLYGSDRPKLELFARGEPHDGWDRFGNELEPKSESILEIMKSSNMRYGDATPVHIVTKDDIADDKDP